MTASVLATRGSRAIDCACELVRLAFQARFGLLEERKDMRIDQLVADTRALFVPGHDASSLQDAQMLRNVLLRCAKAVD